jgi:hypothetical protein
LNGKKELNIYVHVTSPEDHARFDVSWNELHSIAKWWQRIAIYIVFNLIRRAFVTNLIYERDHD